MRFLLDTNILSDLVRHPRGVIARHIGRLGSRETCTSIIVASEMRFGIRKGGSAQLARQVETLLGTIDVLPFEAPADAVYADIRAHLQRAGQPISAFGMLIAAHALTLGLTLVTANMREFSRVPRLSCENWLT